MRDIERLSKRILDEGGATVTGTDMLEPHPLERYRVSARKDLEYKETLHRGDWAVVGNAIMHYLWRLPDSVLDVWGNYLGVWIDEGTLYLDVSRAYASRETAMLVAKRAQQKAVYDAVTGEVIPV
jgi:hypothetical protein